MQQITNFIRHLFESVSRRHSYCRFYAMPKPWKGTTYRILVGVADETMVEGCVEDWANVGYIKDPSHISGIVLCSHNSEYKVLLAPQYDSIEIRGVRDLELKYLRNKQTYGHSIVKEGDRADLLTCTIRNTTLDDGKQ